MGMRSHLSRLVVATAVITATLPLATFGALPPGGTFTDDDGNTHEGNIEAIYAEGITKGCNPPFNDHYCPRDPVTRGQMAAFIRRALDLPASPKNHFTDDNGTTFENDINAIAEEGITKGCNPPDNDEYCPNRVVTRDEMASFLARALDLTPIIPPSQPPLMWDPVVSGLTSPIQVLAPPDENRLLIAQQDGRVLVFGGGKLATFLDIRDQVIFSGERGLLSIALHPDYPADRRMFVWYYGTDSRTRLVEYDIAPDLASASSPRTILSVQQPAANHNGGFLDFGPDGYLYLGLGDGGGGNDAYQNARDLDSLLGKMIRIDVDGDYPYEIPSDNPYVGQAGRDEIWASGLRNPWRWSFDSGRLYIGDVGQSEREEIDVVDIAPVGYDFGWSRFEGTLCNPNDHDPSCDPTGLTFPVVEYGRSVGRTVTGGVVYHGPTFASLDGFYIYADFGSGLVSSFRMDGNKAVDRTNLTDEIGMTGIVDFATDNDGELLAVSLFEGTIYRLTGG